MNATASSQRALDPKDDVSGAEFKEDLLFFTTQGGRNLAKALFWQTVRDIAEFKKNPDTSADIKASAQWPKTPDGRATIEFLMPSVSVDRIVAKLYENPELFISEISLAEKSTESQSLKLPEAGVRLDGDVAASVFMEKPLISEEDQPLVEGHDYAEDNAADNNIALKPSWG